MLVQLTDFGSAASVNPKYVTSVIPGKRKIPGRLTEPVVTLWVVGHAGYGTFEITLTDTTVKEVTDYLNLREDWS